MGMEQLPLKFDTTPAKAPGTKMRMPALSKVIRDALVASPKAAASKSRKPTLCIQFDGSCRGNPGPMGIALVVLRDKTPIGHCSDNLDAVLGRPVDGTNIRAEMVALVQAIRLADSLWRSGRYGAIEISGDSEFAVKVFNGANKPKDTTVATLAAEAWKAAHPIRPQLRVSFIERAKNSRADKLAQAASAAALKAR